MKSTIKTLSLLLYMIVFISSCTRKPLFDECECSIKAKIPVNIDWSHSNINVKNVTLLVYNALDGSLFNEFIYEHNKNDINTYIHLPIGTYNIVVFNELRGQIDYVGCRGYNNLSTLEFYSKDDVPIRTRTQSASYSKQPGDLALQVIRDVKITSDLIIYTKSKESRDKLADINNLIDIKPVKIISRLDIRAHIKGLNNSRMPALADLRNLSSGYMVDSDVNTKLPSNIQFTMNNRIYDSGSTKDGVITATITTFGTLGTRGSVEDHELHTPIELDILFMLVDKDKTVENRVVDVTNIISSTNEHNSTISYSIDVNINNQLTNVKPEGSSDSGFNAEVEDWDSVDIPLQQ